MSDYGSTITARVFTASGGLRSADRRTTLTVPPPGSNTPTPPTTGQIWPRGNQIQGAS